MTELRKAIYIAGTVALLFTGNIYMQVIGGIIFFTAMSEPEHEKV